ncbi:MAG: hypothetical protein HQM14_18280 [SAR324 cluster bacterium]|nr:hypothetical protein [SAR324 cluster bacterium]
MWLKEKEIVFVEQPVSRPKPLAEVWAHAIAACVGNGLAGLYLMTVDCGTDVSFENEENVSLFSSSQWAERGFCNKI